MILSKLIHKISARTLLNSQLKSNFSITTTLSSILNRNHSVSSRSQLAHCNQWNHQQMNASSWFLQNRSFADFDRKNIDLKSLAKGKQIITDNIEQKRMQIRERKEILVQGIRDKKTKVKQKVKEMEEIVERENILTIPNLLCVARSFLAPYIGYMIIEEHYQLAIGLLIFAGITDLVIFD